MNNCLTDADFSYNLKLDEVGFLPWPTRLLVNVGAIFGHSILLVDPLFRHPLVQPMKDRDSHF